ncbi:molybdenum cofactor biosynthesis protein MoaE [Methylophilaceae bacterium]|nr:molybdenum cofactor biosynthesis protein MoaE [Methylophilaceae bacterium]MDC1173642.1 molybdenum cofactor biosynthesis protein MoaE [Methylophilaceae bacterium]|tara:strand:+ start:772 stop:1251 length:480 start_codon:yes stop_codon:yes gene_type:complete
MGIRIQKKTFSTESVILEMKDLNSSVGAIVTFTGFVRDFYDDKEEKKLEQLELEHYAGMTEKMLLKIELEANTRWILEDIQIIHRVGALLPGDPIVLVAVACKHRGDAFDACHFIIDYLKVEAPFWKKEKTNIGEYWVNDRKEDFLMKDRWGSVDSKKN